MLLKIASYFLSLIIGTVFIVLGAIPAVFDYPHSDGPNSGPSNSRELILMIAYEQWMLFLIIGLVICLISVVLFLKLRKND